MKCKKAVTVIAGLMLAMGAAAPAVADGGAEAEAIAVGSPGFLSGNVVQVPINIPLNVCGNGLNILAALNPTGGNICINH